MYNKQVIVLRKTNCVAYASQDSSYIVTRGMIQGSSPLRARDVFEMSRPALDPIKPHVQWAWGFFLGGRDVAGA
jgi:hypothetical protein